MMACATPQASRMARAIVANTSTTRRRMPTPLLAPRALHRSGCTQGTRAVRLRLPLRRTPYEAKYSIAQVQTAQDRCQRQVKSRAALGGRDSEGTRLGDCSDCSIEEAPSTYRK